MLITGLANESGATLQIAATNVNPFVTIDHNGDYVISDAGGGSPGPGCDANGSGQAFCDDSGVTQLTSPESVEAYFWPLTR